MLRDTDTSTPQITETSPKNGVESTPRITEGSKKRGLSRWADPTVGSKTAFMDCILELQTGGKNSPSSSHSLMSHSLIPQSQSQSQSQSQLQSSPIDHVGTGKKSSSPRHTTTGIGSNKSPSPRGKSAALIMEDSEKSGDAMLRLNIQSKIASLLDTRYLLHNIQSKIASLLDTRHFLHNISYHTRVCNITYYA